MPPLSSQQQPQVSQQHPPPSPTRPNFAPSNSPLSPKLNMPTSSLPNGVGSLSNPAPRPRTLSNGSMVSSSSSAPNSPNPTSAPLPSLVSPGRNSPTSPLPFLPPTFLRGSTSSLSSSIRSSASSSTSPSVNTGSSNDPIATIQASLARRIRRKGPTHKVVAATYNLLGNAYFRQGDYAAAKAAYQEAVQCEPGPHLSASYSNLGTIHMRLQEIPQARMFMEQALAVAELERSKNALSSNSHNSSSQMALANLHHQLGLIHALGRDFPLALSSLQAARALRVGDVANVLLVGKTDDAIGKTHYMCREFDKALDAHEAAYRCFAKHGAPTMVPLQNIALVHAAAGRMEVSLTFWEKVRKQQSAANEEAGLIQTLGSMALLYSKMGKGVEAAKCRQEAASLGAVASAT